VSVASSPDQAPDPVFGDREIALQDAVSEFDNEIDYLEVILNDLQDEVQRLEDRTHSITFVRTRLQRTIYNIEDLVREIRKS
jgi:predicted  nucleic acid-binding Zn-ribbon protein